MDTAFTERQLKSASDSKGWKVRLFLLIKMPIAFLAGLRVDEVSVNGCMASVPYKLLSQNPFRSVYFAVQAMAAEFSTAVCCRVASSEYQPSVSFLVVDLQARFFKKADQRVYFTCEGMQQSLETAKKCVESGEAVLLPLKSVGKLKDGTLISEFTVTWSLKQRSS